MLAPFPIEQYISRYISNNCCLLLRQALWQSIVVLFSFPQGRRDCVGDGLVARLALPEASFYFSYDQSQTFTMKTQLVLLLSWAISMASGYTTVPKPSSSTAKIFHRRAFLSKISSAPTVHPPQPPIQIYKMFTLEQVRPSLCLISPSSAYSFCLPMNTERPNKL